MKNLKDVQAKDDSVQIFSREVEALLNELENALAPAMSGIKFYQDLSEKLIQLQTKQKDFMRVREIRK